MIVFKSYRVLAHPSSNLRWTQKNTLYDVLHFSVRPSPTINSCLLAVTREIIVVEEERSYRIASPPSPALPAPDVHLLHLPSLESPSYRSFSSAEIIYSHWFDCL